jgi:hypothetical protein
VLAPDGRGAALYLPAMRRRNASCNARNAEFSFAPINGLATMRPSTGDVGVCVIPEPEPDAGGSIK